MSPPDTSQPSRADVAHGLNPEQRSAVEHFEGPCLVLAGAGSGKTRVLTTRVCQLIQAHGVPPDRIMAVTFTNKAAEEMRGRIEAMLGAQPRGMWMGTFHALGARMLRRHAPRLGWSRSFTIYDAEQALRRVKRVQSDVGIDPKRWAPKGIRGQISNAKNQLVSPEDFAATHAEGFDLFLAKVAKVFPAYQAALRDSDAMDFDDLLAHPVRLLEAQEDIREHYADRFAFILVDEYQDTNRAQFRFLELLASRHRNLMVVGDDDQSIYGWRGADIRNILDFEKSFSGAEVIRLEQNYRSTEVILDAANLVISENQDRKGKVLRTDRRGGSPIVRLEAADEMDEARWIVEEIERLMLADPGLNHRDFAVLYRTNAQARALEDRFRRRGLPYQVVGGVRFYERREVQDVLAYLRLISNPKDADAFERAVNYPRRGIGRTTLERLVEHATNAGTGLLEAAERAERLDGLPAAGRRGLTRFADLIRRYSSHAAHMDVGELTNALVEELDLLVVLRSEGPEGDDRADNVRELIQGAVDFRPDQIADFEEGERDHFTDLDFFLQQVALVADVDRHDPGADTVTLMTLHNAKGLEFPVVFISGMEDGLFPLARSYDDPRLLEEERRLFYVGVTRAEDRLYVTHARQRRRAGEISRGILSSFVKLIDDRLERRMTDRVRAVAHAIRPQRSRTKLANGSREEPGADDAYNQDRPAYLKGERVVHETFGSGVILELSGFGRDLKVTVDFESEGRKKLLVRYAGLEKDYF